MSEPAAEREAGAASAPHRWSGVTIDCLEPEVVARFWSVLGREPGESQPGWVYLGERGDALPRPAFQPVTEPKRGKTRIHLDVTVDDIDAGIADVVRLGGAPTGERHDYDEGVVVVMRGSRGHRVLPGAVLRRSAVTSEPRRGPRPRVC